MPSQRGLMLMTRFISLWADAHDVDTEGFSQELSEEEILRI